MEKNFKEMKPERTKEEIKSKVAKYFGFATWKDLLFKWDACVLNGNDLVHDRYVDKIIEVTESQSSPVESKWVSVKERQPEYMDVVIIYAVLGFVTMAQYGGGNTFCLGDESYSATHWMPLPLSPELPPIEETK